MNYHLAQLNIARFKLPPDHPVNADFINNLDRVNAIAEESAGFVWRLVGEGNDAVDIQAFDDPNIITNMSVWEDMDSLVSFVYKNSAHREIMKRRKEWFERIELYLVLWWIEAGHIPTISEAKNRLDCLKANGPTAGAFTFAKPFAPTGQHLGTIAQKCA